MRDIAEYSKRETQFDMNDRIAKRLQKDVDAIAINENELAYESALKQTYNVRHNIESSTTYNPEDLRHLNTYNALRLLYRMKYDMYSVGYRDPISNEIVGRAKDPVLNRDLATNYLNDFSMSPKLSVSDFCKFDESICKYSRQAYFPFNEKDGPYKDYYNERLNYFVQRECTKKKNMSGNTYDFFSASIQVNPLLYAYGFQDQETGKYITMDSDAFLERYCYTNVFNNESYVMRGNQHNIKLWAHVTNTDTTIKNVYVENEDGEQEHVGTEEIYKNQQYLFKDDYTNKFMTILQNPKRYFKFLKRSNYKMTDKDLIEREIERRTIADIRKQEETRGHLFFDTLLQMVFGLMQFHVGADKTAPEGALKKVNQFYRLCTHPIYCDKFEFDGFPIDLYLAMPGYHPYRSEEEEAFDTCAREQIGDYVLNLYRKYYNVVFSMGFKVLPYVLSPGYKFALQSPAMNIMMMAFTIMACSIAMKENRDDYHVRFFTPLVNIMYQVGNEDVKKINTFNLYDKFDTFDANGFISDYVAPALEKILPILMKNTAAANYDTKKIDNMDMVETDVDTYATDKMYAYVEDQPVTDENRADYMSKALILLTEFFHKMENLRYFDAATFHIEYLDTTDKETCRYLRIFSNALQEACYIYMNCLGTDIFHNGKAPSNNNSLVFSKSVLLDDFKQDVLGMDDTRVLKNNNDLFRDLIVEDFKTDNDLQRHNSFHSSMAIINLYTSLVYCIRITLDNVKVNRYDLGPYPQRNLKRPQSLWTILKRYALHMTYMNSNGIGIYNERKYSNHDAIDIKRLMVSQRVKWLTYGLHLKVWMSDGYFFYSNYSCIMMRHKGDAPAALRDLVSLHQDHVNGITRNLTLFDELLGDNMSGTILPNIGLALAPTAGSYTIQAALACFCKYLKGLPYLEQLKVNMIYHGMKDIMVGDAMSSIVGDRMRTVRHLFNFGRYSNVEFNNMNERMQKIYDDIGTTKYHEQAMGAHLERLYKEVIRPYYMENGQEALMLNSSSSNVSYDSDFFANYNETSGPKIAYGGAWCKYPVKWLLDNYTDKTLVRSLICRITNLYRLAVENYKTYKDPTNSTITAIGYKSHFGYGLSNAPLISKYPKGMARYFGNPDEYGFFGRILDNLTVGTTTTNKPRLSNMLGRTSAKTCFEDNIVRYSAGGCIYGMYEDPMMLIAYNCINFNTGMFKPPLQTLYMYSKDILYRTYIATKKMVADLHYNGEPLRRIMVCDKCDLETAKSRFVLNCMEESYMLLNRDKAIEEDTEIFNTIKNNKDLYDFSTVVAQFMDYDYLAGKMCTIFNNSFDDLTSVKTGVAFLNNCINERSQEYSRYCNYNKHMEAFKTSINNVIAIMDRKKRGSIVPPDATRFTDNCTIEADANLGKIVEKSIETRKESMVRSDTSFPMLVTDDDQLVIDFHNNARLANMYSYNSIGVSSEEMRQIKLEDAQAYNRELKALEEQKAHAKEEDTVPTNMMMEQLMKNAGMLEQPSPYAVNSSLPIETTANDVTAQQHDVTQEEDTNSNINMQYSKKEDQDTVTSTNSNDTSSSNNTVREGYDMTDSEAKQYIDSVGYDVASIATMRRMINAILDLRTIMVDNRNITRNIDKNVKLLLEKANVAVVDDDSNVTTTTQKNEPVVDEVITVVEDNTSVVEEKIIESTTTFTPTENPTVNDNSMVVSMDDEDLAEPYMDDDFVDMHNTSSDTNVVDANHNTSVAPHATQQPQMQMQEPVVNNTQLVEPVVETPAPTTTNTNTEPTMVDMPNYFGMMQFVPQMYCPSTKLDKSITIATLDLNSVTYKIIATASTRQQINNFALKQYRGDPCITSFIDFEVMNYYRLTPEVYITLNDLQRYQLKSIYMNQWIDANKVYLMEMAIACNIFVSALDINDVVIYHLKWFLQVYMNQHPGTFNIAQHEAEALRLIREYNLDGSNPNANTSVQSVSLNDGINMAMMNGGATNANTQPQPNQQQVIQQSIAQQQPAATPTTTNDPYALDYNNLSENDRINLERSKQFRMVGTGEAPSAQVIPTLQQKLNDTTNVTTPKILLLTDESTLEEVKIAIAEVPYEEGRKHMYYLLSTVVDYDNPKNKEIRGGALDMIKMMYHSLVMSRGMSALPSGTPQFLELVKIGEAKMKGLL